MEIAVAAGGDRAFPKPIAHAAMKFPNPTGFP